MDEFITAFEKNSLEEIRTSLLKYKSYYFIDVRVFSAPQRGEEQVSTSSGITLPVSLFEKLKGSLLEVERVLMSKGLFGKEEG